VADIPNESEKRPVMAEVSPTADDEDDREDELHTAAVESLQWHVERTPGNRGCGTGWRDATMFTLGVSCRAWEASDLMDAVLQVYPAELADEFLWSAKTEPPALTGGFVIVVPRMVAQMLTYSPHNADTLDFEVERLCEDEDLWEDGEPPTFDVNVLVSLWDPEVRSTRRWYDAADRYWDVYGTAESTGLDFGQLAAAVIPLWKDRQAHLAFKDALDAAVLILSRT
jgi:hypothetical protein